MEEIGGVSSACIGSTVVATSSVDCDENAACMVVATGTVVALYCTQQLQLVPHAELVVTNDAVIDAIVEIAVGDVLMV